MGLDPRLHDYQVRAIQHLHDRGVVEDGAGLFMDMGLGKTATVLQALTPEHLPALVCAPRRVADEVWEVEQARWRPDLSMRVLTNVGPTVAFPKAGDRREHMLRKDVDADITVITRDQISVMGTRVHPYKTVVLDELSGYKNKSTARWQATRNVARRAEYVWGLTGTPAPNGYHDLYGQIFMLDKGRRLGPTLTAFRDRYFDANVHPHLKIVTSYDLKPGAEAAINRLLADLCVSMKASDYLKDLKEPLFNEIRVHMPVKAQRVYDTMEQDFVVDLSVLGGPSVVHTAANAAALTNRLRQISAGFIYYDQDTSQQTRLHDVKTDAVGEVIDGTGDNVLVFYQYEEEERQLLAKIDGAVSIDEPGAVKAWDRREIPVMVAHPASAGHGLNLQHGGSTICYSSLPWSLEEWQQSVGRLARQGQPNAVMVNWINASPIDAVVFKALQEKQSVQDALLNYLKERHLWL
jgi:SNF2 family DNA or RNA helicase